MRSRSASLRRMLLCTLVGLAAGAWPTVISDLPSLFGDTSGDAADDAETTKAPAKPALRASEGGGDETSGDPDHFDDFVLELQKAARKLWKLDECEEDCYRRQDKSVSKSMSPQMVQMRYFAFGKREGYSCHCGWMDEVLSTWEKDHCNADCYKKRNELDALMSAKETRVHYFQWGKAQNKLCSCSWFDDVLKVWNRHHCDHECYQASCDDVPEDREKAKQHFFQWGVKAKCKCNCDGFISPEM